MTEVERFTKFSDENITECDWVEVLDNSSKKMFKNKSTGEVIPDEPQEFKDWKNTEVDKFIKTTSWRRVVHTDGRVYYYEKKERKTQWAAPSFITDFTDFLGHVTRQRMPREEERPLLTYVENEETNASNVENEENNASNKEFQGVEENGEDSDSEQYFKETQRRHIGFESSQNEAGDTSQEREAMLLENAMAHIDRKDCIMDLDIGQSLRAALRNKSTAEVTTIVQRMCDNYVGYAQMTRIVLQLVEFSSALCSTMDTSSRAAMSPMEAPKAEAMAVAHLATLVKQKFDIGAADGLKFDDIPPWLDAMFEDPTYRRALIELYEENKCANRSSVFLNICLRQISAKGHHREIAQIIGDVDYFEVYNSLLVEMFFSVCVSSGDELARAVRDLKRICCHSEYMFVYAHDLLLHMESCLCSLTAAATTEEEKEASENSSKRRRLADDVFDDPEAMHVGVVLEAETRGGGLHHDEGNKQCMSDYGDGGVSQQWEQGGEGDGAREGRKRKHLCQGHPAAPSRQERAVAMRSRMRRLRQELEAAATWAQRDKYSGKLSEGAQLAVRLKGAYAPARDCRIETDPLTFEEELSAKLFDLLRERGLREKRAQIVRDICGICMGGDDNMTADRARVLYHRAAYLRAPEVLELLMDALVHPERVLSRAAEPTARLMAIASVCDGREIMSGTPSDDLDWDDIAARIMEMEADLVAAAKLCAELFQMANGVLQFDKVDKMLLLACKSAPIGACCLRWTDWCLTAESAFKEKTALFNMLPVLLQLCVAVGSHFPLQRPSCCEMLQSFLLKAPDDCVSSVDFKSKAPVASTLNSAQKDCAQCLLHLMGLGYVLEPMKFLISNSSSFDGSLIRFMVGHLLAIMKPPYSKTFIESIKTLTSQPGVSKALENAALENSALGRFFAQGDRAVEGRGDEAVEEEISARGAAAATTAVTDTDTSTAVASTATSAPQSGSTMSSSSATIDMQADESISQTELDNDDLF